MLRQCRTLHYDSFQAARGELNALFSPYKSHASLQAAVTRYILHRSRHLDSLHTSQQRSWVRSKVSLILQEARRQRRYEVAEAALQAALSAPDVVDMIETTWLKDALASCTTAEELHRLEATLRSHLQPGTDALLTTGSSSRHGVERASSRVQTALTAFLNSSGVGMLAESAAGHRGGGSGTSAMPMRAMTLGDGADVEADTADVAVAERGVSHCDGRRVAEAEPPSVLDVSEALARHTPRATGQDLIAPDQRARNALRRLQRQREQQVVAPNPSFLRYFTRQQLVKDEAELMALFTTLRDRPSKVGFRLHLSQPHGRLASTYLLPGRVGLEPVGWLPAFTGAYTLDCSRDVPYEALLSNRRLLQSLAKERVGAYQSLSSMLPVHLLNPQPGDRVLDMCASPGGKTTLIYDYLVGTTGSPAMSPLVPDAHAASGVVANEAVPARANELALRLQNWSSQIGVTQVAGESLRYLQEDSVAASFSDAMNRFNKILVDAPCSGEGRMGREVMAWRLWHPTRSLDFFPRQRALLRRAVELCVPGGRVVYATCTLNPIENEAVVAAVLREYGEAVRLASPASTLAADALDLSPGLPSWLVPSGSGGFYHTVEEARARAEVLDPGLFAPNTASTGAAANPVHDAREQRIADELKAKCRRVLPHKNPGMDGFFVAVLERTGARRAVPLAITSDGAATAQSRYTASTSLSRSLTLGMDASIADGVVRRSTSREVDGATAAATGASLLQQTGWRGLPPHHPLVMKYLNPFFVSPHGGADRTQMAAVLESKGLRCTWSDIEGLRVLSTPLAQLLSHTSSSSSVSPPRASFASSALREAGVLIINAKGQLTESGATLLAALRVPQRVLRLPLTYYSILLSNQRVEVHAGLDGADDLVRGALRTASNGLAGRSPPHTAPLTPWAATLLDSVGLQEGNAVAVLEMTTADANNDEGLLWAVPVHVRVVQRGHAANTNGAVAGKVELSLSLPSASRHRCSAMLGRVRSAQRRTSPRHARHAPQPPPTDATERIATNTPHHHGVPRTVLDAPAQPPATAAASPAPQRDSPATATNNFVFDL